MTVKVTQLEKRYGARREVVGVNQVSFAAAEKGITSLLGPSGSGKSTLLRMVAGLEVPDAGRVEIDGRDVTDVPVREREIGFVFQNYALFGHMTVAENIAFGLTVKKAPKSEIQDRVKELLELIQLPAYGARLPSQLSGGQRQRVALARALAPRPRVLLLDEPFGALDARVRIELRDWLHAFHEETKVTTLLVTHDQEEALELSEHVVLLNEGRVEQSGSPSDLYDAPASAFVASFLGGAEVLAGSFDGGRINFDQQGISSSVGSPNETLRSGTKFEAFVRPHDFRLEKVHDLVNDRGAAAITRAVRVGAYVKVTVRLADGRDVFVQVPRHEYEAEGLDTGDRVLLDVRGIRMTARSTYSI